MNTDNLADLKAHPRDYTESDEEAALLAELFFVLEQRRKVRSCHEPGWKKVVICSLCPHYWRAGGQGYRICPAQGSAALVDNAYQLLETLNNKPNTGLS